MCSVYARGTQAASFRPALERMPVFGRCLIAESVGILWSELGEKERETESARDGKREGSASATWQVKFTLPESKVRNAGNRLADVTLFLLA